MHLILSEVSLLFLLMPNFEVVPPNPRANFFEIPPTYMEPIKEDRSNLYRRLEIDVKHTCFLSFTVHMENTLIKGHLINPTGDTEVKYTEGYILVSPQQYENYFSPGDVVNLEWTYPRDYLMDSNTIWLTVKTWYDFNDVNPLNNIIGFGDPLFHPQTWDLGIKGICQRSSTMGSIVRYPGGISDENWGTEHKGFASSIENPQHNAVPLSTALIRSLDYDGLPERFTYQKAYLRLHNDEEVFTIGSPGHNAVEKWRDFPLALGLSNSTSTYAAFHLAEFYAVTPDGRYMKPKNLSTPRDYLTQQLYLPPVKNNESKTYSFSLYIEGAGEMGLDKFVWNFTVEKNKNYFGSFPNSDYAVEVS